MGSTYFPKIRAERVTCLCRVVLAAFTLLALRLDPDVADTHRFAFEGVATLFFAYAIVALVIAWKSRLSQSLRVFLHLLDLLVFTACVILTHAAVSGFFVFFIFSVFSAMLRFGFAATLGTALASALVYISTTVLQGGVIGNEGVITVRLASIVVITILLIVVDRYHANVNRELTALAEWPEPAGHDRELVAIEMLRASCALLRVQRAVLIWEEGDEPWIYVASFDGPQAHFVREGPSEVALVTSIAPGAFFIRFKGDEEEIVGSGEDDGVKAPVIASSLRERFGFQAAVVSPVSSDRVEGHLLFLDMNDLSDDDLALAQIAAKLVATRLDQMSASEQSQATAVDEERLRVARDLHDGVLQSLTGAALQLESVCSKVGPESPVLDRLRRIQEVIADDQRELRTFIGQLQPNPRTELQVPLARRLAGLAERFSQQFELRVALDIDPPTPLVSERLAGEIFSIVSEAIANAAKHSGARNIEVSVAFDDGIVRIVADDDGHGFAFQGRYELSDLEQQRRGPVNLKSRVASLGGRLVLDSTPDGTMIEITLPA